MGARVPTCLPLSLFRSLCLEQTPSALQSEVCFPARLVIVVVTHPHCDAVPHDEHRGGTWRGSEELGCAQQGQDLAPGSVYVY